MATFKQRVMNTGVQYAFDYPQYAGYILTTAAAAINTWSAVKRSRGSIGATGAAVSAIIAGPSRKKAKTFERIKKRARDDSMTPRRPFKRVRRRAPVRRRRGRYVRKRRSGYRIKSSNKFYKYM